MLCACPVRKLISHSMPTQGHADGVRRAGRAREWVATQMDTSRNVPPKGTLTGLGVPAGVATQVDTSRNVPPMVTLKGLGVPAGRASGWPPRWTPRAT